MHIIHETGEQKTDRKRERESTDIMMSFAAYWTGFSSCPLLQMLWLISSRILSFFISTWALTWLHSSCPPIGEGWKIFYKPLCEGSRNVTCCGMLTAHFPLWGWQYGSADFTDGDTEAGRDGNPPIEGWVKLHSAVSSRSCAVNQFT